MSGYIFAYSVSNILYVETDSLPPITVEQANSDIYDVSVSDGLNGLIDVFWSEYISSFDIIEYEQSYNSEGVAVGKRITIDSNGGSEFSQQTVLTDATGTQDGGYLVANSITNINAENVASDVLTVETDKLAEITVDEATWEFTSNGIEGYRIGTPSVSANVDGSFDVFWNVSSISTSGSTPASWVEYEQVYSASGAPVGSRKTLYSSTTNQIVNASDAVGTANGGYVFAIAQDNEALTAQTLTVQTDSLGPITVATSDIGSPITNLSVAANANGSFDVFWTEQDPNTLLFSEYEQVYDASGAPLGDMIAILSNALTIGSADATTFSSSLFTTGDDVVDFNNLTADQQATIADGADIYHGLGGDDIVTLPSEANYDESLGDGKTLGWTNTAASTFYTGSQAEDTYTVNGGDGSYFIVEGAGTEFITINGDGSSTITAGAGADTISITGSGANNITIGYGTDNVTITGTGANTVSAGTSSAGITIINFSGSVTASAPSPSPGATDTLTGADTGDVTIGSNSTLEFQTGSSLNGTITFGSASGGTLKIDGTTMPTATIYDFTGTDTIDLSGLIFTPNSYTILETNNVGADGNNILVAGASGKQYTLQLDPKQVISGGFLLSPDGKGGTDVTVSADPVGGNIYANTPIPGSPLGPSFVTGYSTAVAPDSTPYSAVVHLLINEPGGMKAQATGFIIDDHTILTAAHVLAAASSISVYSTTQGGFAADAIVSGLTQSNWRINPNYNNSLYSIADILEGDAQLDFGLIRVPQNVNLSEYGTYSLEPDYSGGTINITGYPGNPPSFPLPYQNTTTQFNEIGSATSGDGFYREGTAVSYQGDSGGPLWIYDDGTAYAVGLVSNSFLGIDYDTQFTSTDVSTITQLKSSLWGNVADGYISGATVFADANGTGELASNDVSTTADANGNFTLTGGTGPLIAFGGTDTSTGLAFTGQLEAPSGSTVIGPLTTVISGLQQMAGLTIAAADQAVLAALSLPSTTDLTTLDPIAGVESGDMVGADAYAAGAMVIDTADAIGSAFATASTGFLGAFEAAFAGLETDIKTLAAGGSLNLADQETITTLINSVAKTEGVNDSSFVSTLSTDIVASNAAVDAKLAQDGASTSLITDVSTVQAVIQNSTFDLTKSVDTITGEAGNEIIIAASATLTSGDKIDGGGGSDTLALEGPGTFNLALPTTLTNIQTIMATEGQAAYSSGGQTFAAQNQIVVLRAGLNATVNVESDASLNANDPKPATITIVGAANSDVINLASGNDVVTVGGSNETVNLGSGNDTINVNAATIAATIGNGTGHNTLDVTGGGTMAMGSNITDIAEALLSPASTAYHFTANAISGLTINDSSTTTADVLTAGGAHQTLTGGGTGKVEFVGAAAGDDTFKNLAALFNGDTISGLGNNGDVIDLTDVSSTGLKPLSYVQTTATSGKLTVSDGVHTAAITLLGQYVANGFHPTSDGGVGTAITYQPAPLALAQAAS